MERTSAAIYCRIPVIGKYLSRRRRCRRLIRLYYRINLLFKVSSSEVPKLWFAKLYRLKNGVDYRTVIIDRQL